MSAVASVVRASHASGLHAVERSLDALHAEMLRSAADDAGHVRLSVLNLVAACVTHDDARVAADVLTAIGARHPARAILIHAHPDDAHDAVEADVSLQRASVGDHEVYTELMQLTVSGAPSFHLASIVTPLLIPDIPTDLWVVGAPRLVQAFSDEAVALTDRVILDSGAYEDPRIPLRVIAEQLRRPDSELIIGDIAWERTRPWRQLISQAFATPGWERWVQLIREVRVHSEGDHSPSQAWLLGGWMASRLGWAEPRTRITVTCSGDQSHAVLREVTVVTGEAGDTREVRVALTGSALCVTSDLGGGRVSQCIAHEQPELLELMSRLLDEARVDALYPAAVAQAASLLP